MNVSPGIYRHFKGGLYKVLYTAIHSETGEEFVVYQPQYGEQKIWIRPLAMFVEPVESQGNMVNRFERLNDEL